MRKDYESIANMPHHVSQKHGHMPLSQRAAQFASFAALSGYEDAIIETARLTEGQTELDESEKDIINERIALALSLAEIRPEVSVTYFKPDTLKSGGEYITLTGAIKRFDDYRRTLTFFGGESIPIDDIVSVKCDIFG